MSKKDEDSSHDLESPRDRRKQVVHDQYITDESHYEGMECCCLTCSYILAILLFPFAFCCMFRTVRQFERAIILRFGKIFGGIRTPGLVCFVPCTDEVMTMDMRIKTYHVPSQEVLTSDSVTIHVNAVVYFHISQIDKAYLNVEDCEEATKLLAQTTLRSVISSKDLTDLLVKRDVISTSIQQIMDHATEPWGINVTRVELRDIVLPKNMQRAMAAEAEATRVGKAKVIAAEGEAKAATNLSIAANTMAQSPGSMQLRYLQTLTAIGAEQNTTIVFPVPLEMFEGIKGIASNLFGGLPKTTPMDKSPLITIDDDDYDDKGKTRLI